MRKYQFLLMALVCLFGMATAQAAYIVDFDDPIIMPSSNMANPHFEVAPGWTRIAQSREGDGYGPYYMVYAYKENDGVDGTGTLLALAQEAPQSNYDGDIETVHDYIVTPLVSGTVTLQVKGHTLSSVSKRAYIEFYTCDESGKTVGTQIEATLVKGDGNTTTVVTTSEWVTATLTLSEPTRVAIRGQYVYMDNFTATSNSMGDVASLTIVGITTPDGLVNGNHIIDANPDGTFVVNYTVEVKNTGNIDLYAGQTENYTLQVFPRFDNTLLSTPVPIDVDLMAGESTQVSVSVTMPASARNSNGWTNYDVRENISGNTKEGFWTCVNLYEPVFVFQNADCSYNNPSSARSLETPVALGIVEEDAVCEFIVWNTGNAPLQVYSVNVPAGFRVSGGGSFSVAALEKHPVTVTLPANVPGIYAGNIEVEYEINGKTRTYTLPISGTVVDPSKTLFTFDDGEGHAKFPAEAVHPDGFYISSTTEGEVTNFYLQSSKDAKFILPLVEARAGEQFVFDAWMPNYNSNASLVVYTSLDRQHWTAVKTLGNDDLGTKPNSFIYEFEETGNLYVGFKLANTVLDNIYGLTLAPTPAHDWYLVGTDFPEEAIQNQPTTVRVSLKNISSSVTEPAGSYTATLYMCDEAVATAPAVTLAANSATNSYNSNGHNDNTASPTVFTFTFRPHQTGVMPAYVEFCSGSYTISTDEFEIEVEEEQVQYEAGTSASGYSTTAPVDLKYANSQSVALYTSQMLNLKDGDKIGSIIYRAYNTDSLKMATTLLSAWYEWTDDVTLSKPGSTQFDTSSMTPIQVNKSRSWEFTGKDAESATDYIVFQFSEPLVYQAGKSLRIFMRSVDPDTPADPYNIPEGWRSENTTSTNFERTSASGGVWCYRAYSNIDASMQLEDLSRECDFYPTDLPAIHLGLVVEPTFFTGTITNGQQPVAGATITLSNAVYDVQYTGTTDNLGQFNIPVIQDKLDYVVTITAEGYQDYTALVSQFTYNVYTLVADGQATAIVNAFVQRDSSTVFDLQGRRVSKSQMRKGLYIEGGRKVVRF